MHKMTYLELDLMYDHMPFSDRPVWDTTRILALYSISPYCKKKIKIQDMFPLPWDDDIPENDELDIMAHTARMNELAKLL